MLRQYPLLGTFLLVLFFATSCLANEAPSSANKQSLSTGQQMFIDVGRCNPQQFTKLPHPKLNSAYYYCNADGTLAQRDCPTGKVFSRAGLDCELPGGVKSQDAPKEEEVWREFFPCWAQFCP